ncbi:uncharacterized protein TRIVIDRAFT_46707 [Trichoderma virens Gv29-8]|uniref:Uncharacterized protein n=1 Tax=Hypocrea virens (strain Gv29-8 / FGSC 10586) TaxID=413071 RepID=G9N1J7_HYPVG|nr:uncharacterized protein TRIVIDRAFT_46707 [Trichoderma virens Gv29-8]EHK19627.1 hypothetical protein TRIVIDRAFT_46707 [Trichoderma virens Gv29-8]UKZ58117.1 hypothetical protein TrVGV298_011982 [Trichoderma virens]
MSQATSFTNESSIPEEKKRNWKARILSSVIGGGAAILGGAAVAALMESEEISFMTCVTVAGVFWGIGTKVAGNVLGSEKMTFILHQHLIQQSYRKTIEQNIGTMLENVVTSIRTNSPFELRKRVYFDVDDMLRFDTHEKRRMFFDFSCKVIPPPGTSPQPLDQGNPAAELPSYKPESTQTVVTETKSLADGIRHGFQEGALLGLAGGALASLLFLVFGGTGVVLGVFAAIVLVSRITHSAIPSASPDRTALITEFCGETRSQMMSLVDCAVNNNVGLEIDMQVWSTAINPGSAHPKKGASKIILQFNRTVSKKVDRDGQDGSFIIWRMGGCEGAGVDAEGTYTEAGEAAGVVKHH